MSSASYDNSMSFDSMMYELQRVMYIETIINEDLKKLAVSYVNGLDATDTDFSNTTYDIDISVNNKFNVTCDDLKMTYKELLPRFINQITLISPNEIINENDVGCYLDYYSMLLGS